MSDVDNAKYFYNNKNIFEREKVNSNNNYSLNLSNYFKYSLTTDSLYKVVSRIDNTLLYVNEDEKYKEIIKI